MTNVRPQAIFWFLVAFALFGTVLFRSPSLSLAGDAMPPRIALATQLAVLGTKPAKVPSRDHVAHLGSKLE
jgi:hypothetical protein